MHALLRTLECLESLQNVLYERQKNEPHLDTGGLNSRLPPTTVSVWCFIKNIWGKYLPLGNLSQMVDLGKMMSFIYSNRSESGLGESKRALRKTKLPFVNVRKNAEKPNPSLCGFKEENKFEWCSLCSLYAWEALAGKQVLVVNVIKWAAIAWWVFDVQLTNLITG